MYDQVPVPSRGSEGIFLFATAVSRSVLGPTQPLGVKWPEREADQSTPFIVEVKNIWNCTSTPQYV